MQYVTTCFGSTGTDVFQRFKYLSPNLRPTDENGDMSMSASSSFELLERGALLRPAETVEVDASVPYAEGTTIDWHREEAVERERKRISKFMEKSWIVSIIQRQSLELQARLIEHLLPQA